MVNAAFAELAVCAGESSPESGEGRELWRRRAGVGSGRRGRGRREGADTRSSTVGIADLRAWPGDGPDQWIADRTGPGGSRGDCLPNARRGFGTEGRGGRDAEEIDAALARFEVREGIAVGTIRVLPQIETARGVLKVDEIALQAPKRVHTLIFGMADFTADLGIDLTPDGTEILYARSRVVVAARAAGLARPIDGPYLLTLHDHAGLVEDCRRARQLGFQGKVVIYPPHVAPVNQAFSALSDEELKRLQEIVTAFEAAEAAGSASIQVNGVFVDYPIYKRALHKLGVAGVTRRE